MSNYAATADLDPRLTPAREDLAASWLRNHVKAARYIEPTRQHVTTGVVSVYRSREANQSIETQLLYGEPVDVYEIRDGWAWVQSARDNYVGYISEHAIGLVNGKPGGDATPTHRIANVGSFVFPAIDRVAALGTTLNTVVTPGTSFKTTPQLHLSYGSLVRIVVEKDVMSELSTGGFIPTSHLAGIDFHAEDPVAEAFRFLGVPYLWGGRSHVGIDCSALVQLVLQACNIQCPRDCEFQEQMVGRPIPREEVRAGDLAFFKGNHVGLMVDDNTMIHASDRAMAVAIDDFDDYNAWRAKRKKPVKVFKRI